MKKKISQVSHFLGGGGLDQKCEISHFFSFFRVRSSLTEIVLSDDSAYYGQKLVNIGNGVFSQFDTSKSRYKSGNISI